MAKIEKLKKDVEGVATTVYPVTIPQAVIDPTSGKSARAELDEKANHGYESDPKTLKVVDDAKADHGYESNPKSLKEVDDEKAAHGYGAEPQKTLKQVDDEVIQLAGELNQTDAKIKDIENILSTSNPSQSAQISVSGVSPLALPKNASNGGMSIKLEGLTDAGVNFTPTGRIRSVGKNLLNGKWRVGKRYIGGVLTDSPTYSVSGLCRVNGATSYRFNWKESLINSVQQFDENRIILPVGSSNTATGRDVTTEANCRYISLQLNTLTPSTQEVRLSKSLTVVPYEPYKETNLYLTAPELRSNGAVKDEIRKGANGYELVKRISEVDGTVLATPVISPISFGGILNSAESGTVYHEPIIADAGVYGTNMPILLTDYPISALEEIIKHENGVDTYLDVSTAVIAGDKLSFTHPSLQSGDLVLFTYSFAKESTNGNITATFYDSNVVKIDTVTGKAYKITDVVTNGVLTRTLTEV